MGLYAPDIAQVGRSAAGRRIWEAGLAYAAEQERLRQNEERRELEASIKRWTTQLNSLSVRLHEAKPKPAGTPSTLRGIIRSVAIDYGLTLEDLLSVSGRRINTIPKQHAMYRCRAETSASYSRIAKAFGGMDHSTIVHGVKVHAERTGAPSMSGGRGR